MALGPQFDNTFWHDAQGEYHHSTKRPGGSQVVEHSGPEAQDYATSRFMEGRTFQGMLMNPHTGTGSYLDPQVTDPEYRGAALHALGHDRPFTTTTRERAVARTADDRYGTPIPLDRKLTSGESKSLLDQGHVDIEGQRYSHRTVRTETRHEFDPAGSYQQMAESQYGGHQTITREAAGAAVDKLVGTLADSHVPIRELRNTPEKGRVIYASPGQRNWAGDYNPTSGNIRARHASQGSWAADILNHELGHKRDPHVADLNRNPDPMAEGVADARGARHGAYANRLASEMQARIAKDVVSSGYTTGSWRNTTDQALYAATRSLVTAHGDAGNAAIPSRVKLFSDVHGRAPADRRWDETAAVRADDKMAHSLVLGHLMEHHPVVRQTIGQMNDGIATAASKAHTKYLSMTTPPPQGVQGEMFSGGTAEKPLAVSPKAKPPAKYRAK